MTEREKAIELLGKLYGPMKEGERVESAKLSLKEIATDLGYDEGQLSRILNPGHGKEKSDETYKRLTQRLTKNLEAEQGKKRHKLTMTLFGVVGCLLLALASQFFFKSSAKTVEVERRLNAEEANEMINLYNGFIRYQLINRGLVFNNYVREGIYKPDEIEQHTQDLQKEITALLFSTREQLGKVHLLTENRIELSTLLKKFNRNNVEENLAEVIPLLLNTQISSADIETAIRKRVEGIQTENRTVFDSIMSLPPEEVAVLLSEL